MRAEATGVCWMSTHDALAVMSGGNPGALSVLCELLDFVEVDGVDWLGMLDYKGLRGPRIWELHADVCDRDLDRLRYHVLWELPFQDTGGVLHRSESALPGGYDLTSADPEYHAARSHGRPGSWDR